MLNIDGRQGEGGGQVLRTSLALSLATGTPFRLDDVRGGRAKPGLLRQHLTALRAAAAVGDAEVTGAELGSRRVSFSPRALKGGNYTFSIGSAGSALLVVQTILPALLLAKEPSTVRVTGGTHAPMAPPFDHFARAFVPALARMGLAVEATLHRHGFFPAGGTFFVVVREAPEAEKLAAAKFLRFLCQAEHASFLSAKTGYLPITRSATAKLRADGFFKEHPNDEVAQQQLANVEPWPWEPMLFRIERDIVDPRLEEAVLLDKDPAAVLAQARELAARPG